MLPTTADIWKLFREKGEETFKALYHEYWEDLYKAAFNVLRDRDQSLDVVQDVFIWIWEHRYELSIRTSIKSYLLAAVKYKAANCLRNEKFRDDFFRRISAIPVLPPEPESSMDVKELEEVISRTISTLPDKCRRIYQLSRKEFLSNLEIAHELGISVKTVENQMTIALRRLRVAMARLFFLFF